MNLAEPEDLARRLLTGERRALAQAITLIESRKTEHRARAARLMQALAGVGAGVGAGGKTLRIGLSGTPGVGKSTYIEVLGRQLTAAGHRVAVLAVDPSSGLSGGSILGDKTRMPLLARDPRAFIRPSPSGGQLGGVARRTRESILLCEAAGFDIILVETLGVGQAEVAVAAMTDLFVLLLAPGGGDELQGVKRGIMELADLVLINKADGDLRPAALRSVADYAAALRLMRRRHGDPEGYPKAMPVAALPGEGVAESWAALQVLAEARRGAGLIEARRGEQARGWFREELEQALLAQLTGRQEIRERIELTGREVAAGRKAVPQAVAEVLNALRVPDGRVPDA